VPSSTRRRAITFLLTCAVPSAALIAGGCSVLYNLDADQCQVDADCEKLGDDFAGRTCIAGLCSLAPPECTQSAECIERYDNSPALCRDGHCLRLTSESTGSSPQCPLVLGAGENYENLDRDPQLIGAFAYMDQDAAFYYSQSTVNFELAINEYNAKASRPVVGVLCDGNQPDLEQSLPLLVEQLQVPAIIAGMYDDKLREAYEWTQARGHKVFFLSPLEGTSTIAVMEDRGLVWNALGVAADLAPAYSPLVTRAEAFMRGKMAGTAGETAPIRLALIESRPELSDLAAAVREVIHFNGGKTVVENGANFLQVRIDSLNNGTVPDLTTAIAEVEAFSPHVVVAIAADEFLPILDALESSWLTAAPADQPRPIYLLAPHLYNEPQLLDGSRLGDPSRLLGERIVGVNFASAPAANRKIYDDYLLRLKAEYKATGLMLDGTENFYDAAWFTLYAVAAAGSPPSLTGSEVAAGMQRLLSGPDWEVGPVDVANILATLKVSGSTLSLQGALGPPDYNVGTGVRTAKPSVWCLGGGFPDYVFQSDVMSYDATNDTLIGDLPCVPGF
jgi:hypothetical protein